MQEHMLSIQSPIDQPRRLCRVLVVHQASYSDPIVMHAGDELVVSAKEDLWHDRSDWTFIWCTNLQGKSGWVPKAYIEQNGQQGRARFDYNAMELSVSVGEEVIVEQAVCGWFLCVNCQGQSGWVPLDHLSCV